MTPLITAMGSTVYEWDLHLFQAIHPTVPPSPFMLDLARAFADGPLALTVAMLGVMVALPRLSMRSMAFKAVAVATLALIVNALIALVWDRARPFVAGAGQAWMTHAATGSFPSDHLTAQWVFAGMLLLSPRTRRWGIAVALLGLPMAWARIYLGVHYPGDMLGALTIAALATLSGWVAFHRRTAPAVLTTVASQE